MSNSANESDPQGNGSDPRPPIKVQAPVYDLIEKGYDQSGIETRGPRDGGDSE